MVDILQRIGIAAEPHQVYESLTTLDGLSNWWTSDVTGDPSQGGTIEFTFGDEYRVVRVEVSSSVPDEQVVWRCVHGPDEWIDTILSAETIEVDGRQCFLAVSEHSDDPLQMRRALTHRTTAS